jgi:hypothetical protein
MAEERPGKERKLSACSSELAQMASKELSSTELSSSGVKILGMTLKSGTSQKETLRLELFFIAKSGSLRDLDKALAGLVPWKDTAFTLEATQ